ncbi:MAG: glycosyltransferase family 2 protein [Deltaproteobacteria bacterium]|nr:MAG: glycosyltransferase family 2 protein [Deltaproteobacteria bacterium]
MGNKRISIIIPTYNAGDDFKNVLKMIKQQRGSLSYELICVDSGSNDLTIEIARDFSARIFQIRKEDFNHGLTRNYGVSKAEGEYVVLMTQDALPQDGNWLMSLVRCLEENKIIAGAYSRQVPRNDCNPFIRERLRDWFAGGEVRRIQGIENLEELERLSPREKFKLFAFDNVSSCIRKDIWKRFPFEKRDFGEDLAWAKKVVERGYRIVFEPESVVIHSHNNSLWYEFKRVYLDHQGLNQLIGIDLFPGFWKIFLAGFKEAIRLWGKIEGSYSWGERLYWKVYAFPYTLSQNIAQFLGSHSNNWLENVGWYGFIDRILKKGV